MLQTSSTSTHAGRCLANFSPSWPHICRFRGLNLAAFEPRPVEIDPPSAHSGPKLDQRRSTSAQSWSTSTCKWPTLSRRQPNPDEFVRSCSPDFGRLRPKLGEIGPDEAEVGPKSAQTRPNAGRLGRAQPSSAKTGPTSVASEAVLLGQSGQTWPRSGEVGPLSIIAQRCRLPFCGICASNVPERSSTKLAYTAADEPDARRGPRAPMLRVPSH